MSTVQVRYIVHDVDAAIAFYTNHLGFHEDMHPAPTFAMLSRGELRLVLSAPSGPHTGGGSALADGRTPEPGGWNRFAVQVEDITPVISRLRQAGVEFRGDLIEGVGGRQAIIEDPSGNPIELFQPTRPEARLSER
jgi:catechol 2,3-dioxygenase-like lactoylglutathione lyase family enzyme